MSCWNEVERQGEKIARAKKMSMKLLFNLLWILLICMQISDDELRSSFRARDSFRLCVYVIFFILQYNGNESVCCAWMLEVLLESMILILLGNAC